MAKKNGNIHPTRIFKTPNELLEAWKEYKAFLLVEAENWKKVQYVGKDGDKVEDTPILPMIKDGFEVWYYNTYGKFICQYFKNQDGLYDDFIPICSHITSEIRAHQITGGMLNIFNASITQRLNGLAEKKEINDMREPRVFNLD